MKDTGIILVMAAIPGEQVRSSAICHAQDTILGVRPIEFREPQH